MSIIVCQVKNTYLLYFVFPLDFRGLSKSEGGQVAVTFRGGIKVTTLIFGGNQEASNLC